MSTVTPTLNLPQAALAAPAAKPALAAAAPSPAATSLAKAADVPSTTVTLSPQATALAAASHPGAPTSAPALPDTAAHDASLYESLKSGIATAFGDVGDAIAGGAQAVVDGVETTLSTANKVVTGALALPFAAVAKVCDAAGAVIDEL